MFACASEAASCCSPAIGCSVMLGQITEGEGGYEMQHYQYSIFSHGGLKNKDTGRGTKDTLKKQGLFRR